MEVLAEGGWQDSELAPCPAAPCVRTARASPHLGKKRSVSGRASGPLGCAGSPFRNCEYGSEQDRPSSCISRGDHPSRQPHVTTSVLFTAVRLVRQDCLSEGNAEGVPPARVDVELKMRRRRYLPRAKGELCTGPRLGTSKEAGVAGAGNEVGGNGRSMEASRSLTALLGKGSPASLVAVTEPGGRAWQAGARRKRSGS